MQTRRPPIPLIVLLLACMLASQIVSTAAAPPPASVPQAPGSRAPTWVDDLMRQIDAPWIYRELAEIIVTKTGRSPEWSSQAAKRVGCLVAKGAVKAPAVHSALSAIDPHTTVSLDEALAVTDGINQFEREHSVVFWLIKQILGLLCSKPSLS